MLNRMTEWRDGVAFADPEYLRLMWLVAALAILAATLFLWRRHASPEKTYGSRRSFVPRVALWMFLLMVMTMAIVALARPYKKGAAENIRRGNIDVVAVLDATISMNADDVRPTRLEVAKRELAGLAANIVRPGDRVAFFVFGKTSVLKLYLSTDVDAFYSDIRRVSFPKNLNHDELLWDTDFSLMLQHVYESLDAQDAWLAKNGLASPGDARRERVLFLVSDGDDQADDAEERKADEEKITKSIAEFRKRRFRVYPIGVGTVGGVPLLSVLRGYRSGIEYPANILDQWAGRATRLQVRTLERIARGTGGRTFLLQEGGKSAQPFLRSVTDSYRTLLLERTEEISKEQEFWQFVLCGALLILLIAIVLY